jgi:hypothetical protein
MDELTWFIGIIWLVLTVFGVRSKETILLGAASVIGIFLGLMLLSDVVWLGFVLIILGFVTLYYAIIAGEKGEKT